MKMSFGKIFTVFSYIIILYKSYNICKIYNIITHISSFNLDSKKYDTFL